MTQSSTKPILGISMGDPAGIGPEICAQALSRSRVHELCRPLVIGDAGVIRQAVNIVEAPLEVRGITSVSQAAFGRDMIDVYDLKNVDLPQLQLGKVSAMAGNAAFEAVRVTIKLAMSGDIAATVTAPIHKEALVLAGHHFPGHTEIFAHFTRPEVWIAFSDDLIHWGGHEPLIIPNTERWQSGRIGGGCPPVRERQPRSSGPAQGRGPRSSTRSRRTR